MTACMTPGCDIDHSAPCIEDGCNRTVMVSSGGSRSSRCEAHVRARLSGAFAAPIPEWVSRARAGNLPTRITGGVRA